ncbi:MAG: hypothetical protein ACE5GY_05545 [Thermodesulfobacteriota bacterium]
MSRRLITVFISVAILFVSLRGASAAEKNTVLVHLKTGLKHDDAQICVAYNMIWAALDRGLKVKVLVDADAVNTFKVGWRGKDSIQGYPLPERLREALSKQFGVNIKDVPATYGQFLDMLNKKGAEFYINTAFLVLAGIETDMGTVKNVSAKFFKPVTLKEMLGLMERADIYMVY